MSQTNKKIFFKIGLIWTLFFAVLFFAAPVLAQTPALDTGIDYAKATGLVNSDIRIIIARIINVALGLLGIVAVALVIWGGYEYMTAGGDEEQIGKAKKILLNAAIGLAIILSAYAITQFVISKLTEAIIAQYQQQAAGGPGEPTNCVGGQCYSNTAFYATVEPQGTVPLKNIVVNINFKEEPGLPAPVDKSTVTLENIKVVKVLSGANTASESLAPDSYPGFLQFAPNSGDSTVEFHPTGSCAPENIDNNVCFEKNTTYKVILNSQIKEAQISGLLAKNLDCEANHHACAFYFTTGEKYDNAPPQAAMVLPGNGANLPTGVAATVSAMASDETGLASAVFHSSKEKVPFFNVAFESYPLSVSADQLKYEKFIPQLTDAAKKETWQLSAEVKDIAGHSTVVQQSVNVLPEFCFKGKQDVDETGIDCGPNCGACAGATCDANVDCASGYCDLPAKKCAVKTKITNVDPKDGAPGNYVTIFGENFGDWQAGKGQVIFLGDQANATDDKIATVVSCSGQTSWQDDFIVAQVPVGAISGPIKVVSTDSTGPDDQAHADSTNDDFGPVFFPTQVFVVNKITKPGICGINPQKQNAKKQVTINGANFGAAEGQNKVKFGDVNAVIYTNGWTDKSILAQVPITLPAQKLTVKTVVNNQSSNSVPFEILPAVKSPHIDYIDPVTGPQGGYVTIYGSNFGQSVGKVTFYKNNETFNAEPLPNECGGVWSDNQIVVKVPSDDALTNGNAVVRVYDNDNVISDNIAIFKIDSTKKQINLCKIEPNNGPWGQPVTLFGEGFEPAGKKEGKVEFSPAGAAADFFSWTDKKIDAKVPGNAQSGPVKVTVSGDNLPAPVPAVFPLNSNSLNFKVQNCQEEIKNKGKKLEDVCGLGQQCCPSGICIDGQKVCATGVGAKAAVFAWSFSPGKLPVVPEVVVACGDNIVPSPTPSPNWGNSDQVCVNAEIKARFTSLIDNTSIPGSMLVEACDNEACDNPVLVQGKIDYNLSNIKFLDAWLEKTGDFSVLGTVQDTLTFKPLANNGLLEQNKWYRVTLTTDIKSQVLESPLSGANMLPAASEMNCVDPAGKKASYCFKFKTQNSPNLCKLGSAVVSPSSFTAEEFNKVYKDLYNVTAIAADNKCWSINASAYNWQWNAGTKAGDTSGYADLSKKTVSGTNKGAPIQDLITKNKETPAGGEKVWAKTISDNNDVKASSSLFISPKKPKITSWWPQCEAACPNAAIGAKFDADMDLASFKNAVKLKKCGQGDAFDAKNCLNDNGQYLSAVTADTNSQELIFQLPSGASLSPGFWYEVSFSDDVKSVNGSNVESASKHSWDFKVKNDPSKCALDHVNIFPASSTVYWIGDSADYLAMPFSSPDSCSATGQMLTADTYDWSWSAADTKVAKISQNNFDAAQGSYNYLASSTAVGQGAVNADKQQVTKISTAAEGKTSAPLADFILQCGFSPTDADCPLPNGGLDPNVGIGSNSCCYERPSAVKIQPWVNSNVCPNTAITLDFTQPMATSTFMSSTLGAYNIILAEDNGAAACPVNTYQVAQETVHGFWQKVKNWFNVLLGRPAQAQIYCAGGIKYKIAVNGTKASLLLDKPLAGEKTYKIIVTKDVKSLYGISVSKNQPSFSFTTKKELCEINNIKVDPAAWLFKTTKDDLEADGVETGDKDKIFFSHAYYQTPGVADSNQEIQPFSKAYDWKYNWATSDASIVKLNTAVGKEIVAEVAAPAKNGTADIGANATITADASKNSTVGKVFSATSTVQVFICENPWPNDTVHADYGLGYVDAEGNGNSVSKGQGWSNFKLLYCRDAGNGNDKSDDLPELKLPTVLTHKDASGAPDNTGIFKEFFASFAPANKNSIGLRVYANTDHLPLMDWYKNQKLTGAPAPMQVGPYKALQEGRTYYIDGVNSSIGVAGNTTLFSNVYVFSFSDNPTAETLNIINQLLSNFTLNVNVADKEVVAKMYRDYQRLQDLKLISDKLWSYYGKKGEYPKLTENPQLGTYLPAYTNSKWKSWQGVLGNLVGYTLPVDPLNGFKGCGEDGLGDYDAETCWNAANSTFVCPSGSRVYQYSFLQYQGDKVFLKTDFELPEYSWHKSLSNLKPADNIYYSLSNVCNNVVQGIGEKCGDGIVGYYLASDGAGGTQKITEVCEVGQSQYINCSPSDNPQTAWLENNYPGKRLQTCDNCNGWKDGPCVVQGKCGDGVKQGAEKCDDGKNNGKYGYCKTDCSGTSAEFCGNGKLDTGKEVCDLNTAVYNAQKDLSCSWDCQKWDYCGDGVVHKPYEQCEKSESCQVGVCDNSSSLTSGKFCEKDSNCVVYQEVQIPLPQGGFKKDKQTQNSGAKCLDYKPGKKYCGVATEFVPIDATTAAPYYYKDDTKKFSGYSGKGFINCDWWGTDTFVKNRADNSVICLPLEKPTPVPSPSLCGNGKIEAGEVCDDGANNGVECSWIPNANTCTYCAYGCQQVITKSK